MPNRHKNLLDSQLVDLARQKHPEAFNELIKRHGRRCLALALSILHNPGEAEDECQNGYCNAYVHLDQFHGDAEFVTWLLRIIENQCLMLLRRKSRVRFVHLDDVDPEHDAHIVQIRSNEADPEYDFRKREILAVMKVEIRRTPPLLRQMLLLRELNELPMQELADKLGISVAAAKTRLLRARGELRKRMQRHYDRADRRSRGAGVDHSFQKQLLAEMNARDQPRWNALVAARPLAS
jgi:RNA polymerase sigma-70 factor (ECF subfamily)